MTVNEHDVVAPEKLRIFSRSRVTFDCCGVAIDSLDTQAAATRIQQMAYHGETAAVHLCNAYTLSLAAKDPEFTALLNRSQLNLPDGAPVAWVGRGLRRHRGGASRGPDVVRNTIVQGQAWGMRHYFYGGTPETLSAFMDEIAKLAPEASIVGSGAPPFRALTVEEEREMGERIRAAAPDVVWVSLGTPRQDVFVDKFAHVLGTVLVPVGAAFNFIGGTQREAPSWLRHTGLEWVFRLATEPRRLLKRYLVGNSIFVLRVLRDLVGRA